MKYRRKSPIVEAFQYQPELVWVEGAAPPDWLQNAIDAGVVYKPKEGDVALIVTLLGLQVCEPGDWIIRHDAGSGSLYPCDAETFALMYEAVEA